MPQVFGNTAAEQFRRNAREADAEYNRFLQKAEEAKSRRIAFNEQAADLIFEEKNQDKDLSVIDLHELFVKEAIEKLEERFKELHRRRMKSLVVIVGQGHHSSGEPKLKPAVKEWAEARNIGFTLDFPNPGCIKMKIKKLPNVDAISEKKNPDKGSTNYQRTTLRTTNYDYENEYLRYLIYEDLYTPHEQINYSWERSKSNQNEGGGFPWSRFFFYGGLAVAGSWLLMKKYQSVKNPPDVVLSSLPMFSSQQKELTNFGIVVQDQSSWPMFWKTGAWIETMALRSKKLVMPLIYFCMNSCEILWKSVQTWDAGTWMMAIALRLKKLVMSVFYFCLNRGEILYEKIQTWNSL